jgi:hypothetical protein
VRRRLSGATPTLKVSEPNDVTVKHVPEPRQYRHGVLLNFVCAPLTDMLSPS